MKNTMKKICAIVLAVIMTCAMVTCAMAASITVTDVDGNAKATSTFSAYRVFEWKAEDGDDVYTAIKPTAAFKAFFDEHEEYDVITISELKADEMSALTDALQVYVAANKISATATSKDAKFDNLAYGYYLVTETATASDSATVASKAMLVCVPAPGTPEAGESWNDDVVVVAKDDTVKVEKKIVEADGTLVDSNAVNLGDTVNFVINGTVPKYDSNAVLSTIVYAVRDTLCKGLTLNEESIVVTSGDKTYVDGKDYKVDVKHNEDETTTFTVNFFYANIMDVDGIVINYSADLNANAVTGEKGNPNTVNIIYTTTPEQRDDFDKPDEPGDNPPPPDNPPTETGKTPDDKTLTFCAELKILKVNGEGEILSGVKFGLYKDEACTIPATFATKEVYTTTKLSGEVVSRVATKEVAQSEIAITDEEGNAYFSNVAPGTYYIKEIETLKNYKLLDDAIKVVVEADIPEVVVTGEETATWSGTATLGEEVLTANVTEEAIELTVVNILGAILPGTGGIGTALFTVLGVAMISTAAVVAVVYKKRRNNG